MKPIIRLFLDMEFTSLSPDAQIISLGIVSEEIKTDVPIDAIREFDNGSLKLKNHKILVDSGLEMKEFVAKSFYAEFSDFDLNRCDDWVKENVISKLLYNDLSESRNSRNIEMKGNFTIKTYTEWIKQMLSVWLSQFSDYNIQFVVDCGCFDWYHLLQLIGEWDEYTYNPICPICGSPTEDRCDMMGNDVYVCPKHPYASRSSKKIKSKIGLPKLPSNISPVPLDLNDLIAHKKGISVREAFELNREEMASSMIEVSDQVEFWGKNGKHNSLWDSKVIKTIYQKLQ